MQTTMVTTWIRVTESNSVARPWFGSYGSKTEAERKAREALGGCRRGEGYVELYTTDPRLSDADPYKVLRA